MYYDCDGTCINDIDVDGECDEVDFNDGIGIEEVFMKNNRVLRMIDVLGRENTEHEKGKILFYLYEDGRVEKRIK